MEVIRGSFAELWQYRELFWFFAWRDIKVRYRQTLLGVGWAVVQPLVGMIVLTLVFGRLMGASDLAAPYPLFAYCGLVPWTYFSGTLTQAGNSLVLNSHLIRKVYFPRVLLPASSAASGLLDFVVSSAFLVVLLVYYRIPPSWALLLYPLPMIGLWLFTLSTGMWLAALNVRYRDVKYTIPFLVQLGLFVTPVIYPKSLMSSRLQPLLGLNPLAGLIEAFRACLFPRYKADFGLVGTSLAVGAVVVIASGVYFRKTERAFADIV